MALTSWSSSNYLARTSAAVVSAYGFAIDGWAQMSVIPDWYGLALAWNGSSNELRGQLFLSGSTGFVTANVRSTAAGGSPCEAGAAPSTNTWFYWTGSFVSTTLREAYFNAANRAQETTSNTPATADRFHLGIFEDLAGWGNSGAIAEVACWNLGSMTQTQRETLWSKRYNGGSGGNGANPLAINAEVGQPHTGALIAYWRLTNTGDLNDLSGNGHNLSMVGTLTNWGGASPPVDAAPTAGIAPSGDGLLMFAQWARL